MPSSCCSSRSHWATEPMSSAPRFGYQTKDSDAAASDSSRVRPDVHHGEAGRPVVDELADRLGALGDALAVDVDALLQLGGRRAHAERQEPEAHLADDAVGLRAARSRPTAAGADPAAASAAPDASASTSSRPRTRTRRSSSSRRCGRSPPATSPGCPRGGCRSPPARPSSRSDRCRTRPARPR